MNYFFECEKKKTTEREGKWWKLMPCSSWHPLLSSVERHILVTGIVYLTHNRASMNYYL